MKTKRYKTNLQEELTSVSLQNIKSLGIILAQARKFKSAIEGVENPALIEKSIKILKKLTDESFKIKSKIRSTVNFFKNRKAQISKNKNNTISIRSLNEDIKKLENAYYEIGEVNRIISSVKIQLRKSIEKINKYKEQEKKQEQIKNKSLDYVTTQGVFKIIGKFLREKLSKKNIKYIDFYNSYVLLGMDFNTISKGNKKTYSHNRVLKYRLEQFIEKFIQTGELQKYIKKHSGLNINFKNKKITLSTTFGTGSHSENLLKKDVSLKKATN